MCCITNNNQWNLGVPTCLLWNIALERVIFLSVLINLRGRDVIGPKWVRDVQTSRYAQLYLAFRMKSYEERTSILNRISNNNPRILQSGLKTYAMVRRRQKTGNFWYIWPPPFLPITLISVLISHEKLVHVCKCACVSVCVRDREEACCHLLSVILKTF